MDPARLQEENFAAVRTAVLADPGLEGVCRRWLRAGRNVPGWRAFGGCAAVHAPAHPVTVEAFC